MDQFDRGCAWRAGITERQERETELGEVLDLEKRDFLDLQSELEADLNQHRVLFRVAMLLDYIQ
ncbi:hypothetical protein [Marinobacter nauticus]|uniref:hypothetical protein n=1 Tax=Marinobacter nauticus TaxID=2743 RepID=UPI001C9692E7|nr:hypothetical protein [Marinobacter nauticus]MBY5961638.1 hypothetical protein [Marinobacter nauticus]MBY6103003.1 hypothetical protein [Marinobacter nauticus]